MIDEETARNVATRHLDSDEFELREFAHGWRIVRPRPAEPTRGGGTMVVERSTGKLIKFRSGIPPRRIEEEFAEVRSEARELA